MINLQKTARFIQQSNASTDEAFERWWTEARSAVIRGLSEREIRSWCKGAWLDGQLHGITRMGAAARDVIGEVFETNPDKAELLATEGAQ